MMLWKCYTEYASKFGKLSSGHRTGKGQFSLQPLRKAIAKNVQTTAQLHLSHMLAKWCSKLSKWGFNSTWTENFQMFELGLEKAKKQRSNCQHPLDHRTAREFQKETSASLTVLKPLTVWITRNWKILQEIGIPDHLCLLRNLYAGQEATVRTGHGTTYWFKIGKEVQQGCILSLCLFNFM